MDDSDQLTPDPGETISTNRRGTQEQETPEQTTPNPGETEIDTPKGNRTLNSEGIPIQSEGSAGGNPNTRPSVPNIAYKLPRVSEEAASTPTPVPNPELLSVDQINERAARSAKLQQQDLIEFSNQNTGEGAALPFTPAYDAAFSQFKAIKQQGAIYDQAGQLANQIKAGQISSTNAISSLNDLKTVLLSDPIYNQNPALGRQQNLQLSNAVARYFPAFQKLEAQTAITNLGSDIISQANKAISQVSDNPDLLQDKREYFSNLLQSAVPMIGSQRAASTLVSINKSLQGAYYNTKINSDPVMAAAEIQNNKDDIIANFGYQFYQGVSGRAIAGTSVQVSNLQKNAIQMEKDMLKGNTVDVAPTVAALQKIANVLPTLKGLNDIATNLTFIKGLNDGLKDMSVADLQATAAGKPPDTMVNAIKESLGNSQVGDAVITDQAAKYASKKLAAIAQDPQAYIQSAGYAERQTSVNYLDPSSLMQRAVATQRASAQLGVEVPLLTNKETTNLIKAFSTQNTQTSLGQLDTLTKNLQIGDKLNFYNQLMNEDKTGVAAMGQIIAANPNARAIFDKGLTTTQGRAGQMTSMSKQVDSDQLRAALGTGSDTNVFKSYLAAYEIYKLGGGTDPKEMLGVVKDKRFGDFTPPAPYSSQQVQSVLNSLKDYEGLIKHANGVPRMADGSILNLDDSNLHFQPSGTPGEYYLMKGDSYVGASDFNALRGSNKEIKGKFMVDLRGAFNS